MFVTVRGICLLLIFLFFIIVYNIVYNLLLFTIIIKNFRLSLWQSRKPSVKMYLGYCKTLLL